MLNRQTTWTSTLTAWVIALAHAAHAQITIDTPKIGTQVCPLTEISGKIAGAAAVAARNELWIVVHPKMVGDCWVQDPVSVAADGTWSGFAHFGERPAAHDGLPYEFKVMVLSRPPAIGKTACWPIASWVSLVVTVTRRQTSQCP